MKLTKAERLILENQMIALQALSALCWKRGQTLAAGECQDQLNHTQETLSADARRRANRKKFSPDM